MNDEMIKLNISKALIHDIEFITQNLKTDRDEWLKVKIAELISKERNYLLQDLDYSFENGHLDEKGYKDATGLMPTQTMKDNKKYYANLTEKGRVAASKYLSDMMMKAIDKKQSKTKEEENIDLMLNIIKSQSKIIKLEAIKEEAKRYNIDEKEFDNIILELKRAGEIFAPRKDEIGLI